MSLIASPWVLLAAAVLLFWAVGAHNRLRALRNQVLAAWPAVDAALALRAQAASALADALAALPEQAAHADSLRAALAQVRATTEHARPRPALRGAVAPLAAAEAALAPPLARLQAVAGLALQPLADAQRQLAFARQAFNAAAAAYNDARDEFPTLLLAPLLRLGPAGSL